MTKVLYVLKRFPRLSETFILDELLRLEAAGVEVAVDSLKAPEAQPSHPQLARLEAEVRYLPSKGRATQSQMVARRALEGGFTVIHAHFATSATEVAVDAGAAAALPVTATFHAKDIFHRQYAPGLAQRVSGVSAVVTVSEYNAAHLARVLPGTPVEVIYNGVGAVPRAAATPDGPVLAVARLVPKKGLDLLVRATALLAVRGHEIPVMMVGDGPLRGELETLAADLGVAGLVTFTGPLTRPEVDAAYAAASMFVLPCRIDADGDRDGMPTVLGEAMRRGLPVISTNIIGIPELVRSGETGMLVEPENPAAVADAIAGLRDDPAGAAELARKGAAHAAALLDPAAATAALVKLFEEVGRR
ncbi:MAG: glycosyltransferase family 4 protein [Acidimicrobiia bacterium]